MSATRCGVEFFGVESIRAVSHASALSLILNDEPSTRITLFGAPDPCDQRNAYHLARQLRDALAPLAALADALDAEIAATERAADAVLAEGGGS